MATLAPYARQLSQGYAEMGASPMAPQSMPSNQQGSGEWWEQTYGSAVKPQNSSASVNALSIASPGSRTSSYSSSYNGNAANTAVNNFNAQSFNSMSNQDFARSSMDQITDSQQQLMQSQSDLNLRNAQQLMAAEHGYGLAGMTHANELAKGLLQNQTASNVRELQETGLQQRLLQQESGFQNRQTVAEQGYQTRANTRVSGQESRAMVRTQGDEARRNVTHDRDDALRRATSLNRRA